MNDRALAYGMIRTIDVPYERAIVRTREALAEEGFGVLSEIDIQATLKKKLDVDTRPYTILGACNPPLAHQAFNAEPSIGLLLPCNLVVYAANDADRTVVAAIDPEVSLGRVGNEALAPLAAEVKARLERVLDKVAG